MKRAVKWAVVRDRAGFEHRLKGSPTHFTALADDDELVQMYPSLFTDMPDGPRDRELTADASRTRGMSVPPHPGLKCQRNPVPVVVPHRDDLGREVWRLGLGGDYTEFAPGLSRIAVLVTSRARAELLEVLRLTTDRDGFENGGLLACSVGTGTIQVAAATGPGERAHRGPDSFGMDHRDVAELLAWVDRQGFSQYEAMRWHSHPRGLLGAQPSRADCDAFRSWRRLLGQERSLQLICVPHGETGWSFEAFVVSEGRDGRDQVQRARVLSAPPS